MSITTEKTFETAIVDRLTENGGWINGNDKSYDKDLALFPTYILSFLHETQPRQWEKLAKIHGADVEAKLLQRLCKELELRGTIDVLRKGITDYGVKFNMAYFKPESSLNPETLKLYDKNQLHITRQVHYTTANNNSLDLVLSVNGLPVATVEIKNHFTGQDVGHAKKQFVYDRDPKELLFRFKVRALVHFAVDPEQVYMTTRLDGAKTKYLPFNLGHNKGAGNPPNSKGYKTSYLWEQVWSRDSWMDLLGRFVHLQSEDIEDKATGKKFKKESIIFPRYHQLDAVRKISTHARQHGAGNNYLIQHSAGSGKSNSIAWLAYRLSGLHNAQNQRIFDSVIVVTDRKVLDQQLQNNIFQFEHKTGVVQKIDKDSTQLADSLTAGTHVIITTLQKFPFIVDKIGNLPDRKYAVIIDEAHSSQGGEASKKMKEILAAKSLEDAVALEDVETDDDEDYIVQSMNARGKQANISFFCIYRNTKV